MEKFVFDIHNNLSKPIIPTTENLWKNVIIFIIIIIGIIVIIITLRDIVNYDEEENIHEKKQFKVTKHNNGYRIV